MYVQTVFSQGDLSSVLCDPLLVYANDIKYNYVWQGIEESNNFI